MTDGAIHVGFIGLGHMGHGMANNILKRGFPLHVMADKNRKALDDVVYRGAQEVSTPKATAASCDIVLLCVPGAKEVEPLVAGDDGLAAGSRPGLTIVDCTTSDPSIAVPVRRICAAWPRVCRRASWTFPA
jgi:3-hydroxyisobutyrate dehydrogenase-like beta-hydroxyacid dehydrogenase